VAELVALGLHVAEVAQVGRGLDGDHLLDHDALAGQGAGLVRVVAEQADAADPDPGQDLGGLPVVAAVHRQAEAAVGLHGVLALVLEHVRPELVDQPDPAALVAGDVQQQPAALGGQAPHGQPQLGPAVAAQRAQGVAGQAARVQAGQDAAAVPDVPAGEQQIQVARGPAEGAQVELPRPGRQREVGEWLGRDHDGSLRLLSVTGPSVRERR
jgi:hypothetical protein